MLVKLCDLLAKLYAADHESIIEALRIVRLLDTLAIDQIAEVIMRGKSTLRPVFYNPATPLNAVLAEEQHLKNIAFHVKQKTDLANNLKAITKIADGQLDTLARFIGDEQEAVIGAEHAAPTHVQQELRAIVQSASWARQKELNSGERKSWP